MPTLNGRNFSSIPGVNLKANNGAIRFEVPTIAPTTTTGEYLLYIDSSGNLIYNNGSAAVTLGASGGGGGAASTWDAIYSGDKTLTIGVSTFTLAGTMADGSNVVTVTNIAGSTGAGIQITNSTTSNPDIKGTSDTWKVLGTGAATFLSATLSGTADSTIFTITAGNVVWSDTSLAITDADNAASFSVTNDSATSASVFVWAGSGAFTGNTTSSFFTLTPSGLTTGTAFYLPVAALTTGKAIHVVANAATDGLVVNVTSSNTTLSSTGRLLNVAHSGNATVSGVIVEFSSAGADETTVLKLTASAALALGVVQVISASSMTTGKALQISDLDSLTDGMGIHVASAGTVMTSTGHLLFVNHTGATTVSGVLSQFSSAATDETVVVGITASGALALGTILKLSGASVTTGNGIVLSDLNALTTGQGLHIASSATAITSSGHLLYVNHTGTTGTSAVLSQFTSACTDETVVVGITCSSAITSVGLSLIDAGTGMTSGSLLRVSSGTTAALATNGVVSFTATGNFTSTSPVDGGFFEIKAASTTSGTIFNLVGSALTDGVGIQVTNGTSALTTGSLIHVAASGTGTLASNGVVSIRHNGIFVSTSRAGVLDVNAQAMVGTASNATLVNFTTTAAAQVDTTVLNVENSGFTTGYVGSMLRIKSPTTTGACKLIDVIADGMTSGGIVMNISVTALTTGDALVITNGTSAITTGSLLKISAGGTGAIATDGIVSLTHAGIYTVGAATVGFVNITANATTAGTVLSINATGLVDGVAINVASAEAGLTTGKYLSLGTVFTVSKFGATVISGTAQGTAALTLTAGDLVLTAGNATVGGKFILSGTETIAAGGTSTALSLTKSVHYIDADAGGDIFTLADGVAGQVMAILLTSSTGVATITPTNLAGGTSVTLNADGEAVLLMFQDTEWFILGGNGYTII